MAATRRLTAILAADVAGYSRLMGADEEGTHQRVMAHLEQLIDPKIREHRGRTVKNTGDGLLAEFASVVDAMRCAAEIQRGIVDREPNVPDEQRIRFRIGINLGDVIVEEHDIFGDGVNIAARLEALADPGGICISATVHEQVRGRLDFFFEDIGEQRLKNIAHPVRVYRVIPDPAAVIARLGPFLPDKSLRPAIPPAHPAAVSNVPWSLVPRHFMGREDDLTSIDKTMLSCEGRVAITALHGLRGVGKTVLAAAYCERSAGGCRATWWVRAQSEPGLRGDLVSLGVRLGWVQPGENEESALVVVLERLRREGEGILLVFDNAVDAASLRPYLPQGGSCRVLITSNTPTWRSVAEPVEIHLWSKLIGADYLIARTGRHREREAAEALSEALGGLPLAHEQAGAYCERLEIGMAEYHKRLEAAPARMLDNDRDAPAEYHDRLTVAKTFGLAIEEASRQHPAAEPLLVYAALLAPEPIPLFLFAEGRVDFGEPLASMFDNEALDEAVAALRSFALVHREKVVDERDPAISTDTIRLHRLVRQVAAQRREGEALEQARRELLDALATVYPRDIYNDFKGWPRARRLDGLTLAMVGGDSALPVGTEAAASSLMNRLAVYRHGALGAYAPARFLYERALAIRQESLGPDHPDTAQSCNDLARLLQAQRDLGAAQPLFERALAIREQVLGPHDRLTAHSLSNLAELLRDQGDLAGARPLFERALAIWELLGPEHPDTAVGLNDLAVLLRDQGDLAAARPLFERALAIWETLGSDHLRMATSLIEFGILSKLQGDLATARLFFERALAMRQNALGPDHLRTAIAVNHLAELLRDQGDLAAAQPLFERVLAIRQNTLGPSHPDTAIAQKRLAGIPVQSR